MPVFRTQSVTIVARNQAAWNFLVLPFLEYLLQFFKDVYTRTNSVLLQQDDGSIVRALVKRIFSELRQIWWVVEHVSARWFRRV